MAKKNGIVVERNNDKREIFTKFGIAHIPQDLLTWVKLQYQQFKGYTTQRVCDIARCIKKMGIPLSLIILQQIDIINNSKGSFKIFNN